MRFTNINENNHHVQRLISIGIEQYAKSGKKTSVNQILSQANVPKGVFYYHFTNKKNYFEFLIYYVIKIFISEIELLSFISDDFIERITQITLKKMEIIAEMPYLFEFYNQIDREQLQQIYINEFGEYSTNHNRLYSGVDFTIFNQNLTVDEIIMTINNCYLGIFYEFSQAIKFDQNAKTVAVKKIENQSEVLKRLLYRKD